MLYIQNAGKYCINSTKVKQIYFQSIIYFPNNNCFLGITNRLKCKEIIFTYQLLQGLYQLKHTQPKNWQPNKHDTALFLRGKVEKPIGAVVPENIF